MTISAYNVLGAAVVNGIAYCSFQWVSVPKYSKQQKIGMYVKVRIKYYQRHFQSGRIGI